jgi:hypothetical protein
LSARGVASIGFATGVTTDISATGNDVAVGLGEDVGVGVGLGDAVGVLVTLGDGVGV